MIVSGEGDDTMKLSEAILLGSTVVSPKAGGQYFSQTQEGCALGMAAVARGCTFGPARVRFEEKDRRTLGVETVWGNWVLLVVERPCGCWRFRVPHEMRIKDIIAHLFDHHVTRKGNWTMEKLAAWVETVEPKDLLPENIPSRTLRHRWFSAIAAVESQAEIREWQSVREAFEARHKSKPKRGRPDS